MHFYYRECGTEGVKLLPEKIADALEEDIDKIQQIVDVAYAFAPAFDEEKVMEAWSNMQSMKLVPNVI